MLRVWILYHHRNHLHLKHLKKIPEIDHEIDVLVTDEIVKNCLTPHVIPGNLEILELKIRCAFYQKNRLTLGIDPGGICGLVASANKHLLFKKEFDNIDSMVQNGLNPMKAYTLLVIGQLY